MTLTDLLAQLRLELSDSAGQFSGDVLWSDAQLTMYLNWAQNRFARETLCLRDATTPAATQITLQPNVASYALHPGVLEILSARLEGSKVSLWPMNYRNFDPGIDPAMVGVSFTKVNEPNAPVAWAADYETHSITLAPTPQASQTLYLRVIRLPVKPLNVAVPTMGTEVPDIYALALIDGAAYRALTVTDVDGYAAEQAGVYKTKFEDEILRARHDMRRLLRQQPRFVTGTWGAW